jgi:hypothetical protein
MALLIFTLQSSKEILGMKTETTNFPKAELNELVREMGLKFRQMVCATRTAIDENGNIDWSQIEAMFVSRSPGEDTMKVALGLKSRPGGAYTLWCNSVAFDSFAYAILESAPTHFSRYAHKNGRGKVLTWMVGLPEVLNDVKANATPGIAV